MFSKLIKKNPPIKGEISNKHYEKKNYLNEASKQSFEQNSESDS